MKIQDFIQNIRSNHPWKYALIINLIISMIYIGFAELGFLLAFKHRSASVLWLPTGFSISMALFFGNTTWVGIFLGAFFANIINFVSGGLTDKKIHFVSFFIAIGNTIESICISRMFKKLDIGKFLHVLLFSLYGAIGCFSSALIGPATLLIFDMIKIDNFGEVILIWWVGDYSGLLTIVPLIISLIGDGLPCKFDKGIIEFFLFIMFTVIGNLLWFGKIIEHDFPLAFFAIIPFIWGSFRYRIFGVSISITITSIIATIQTINNTGPFFFDNDINRSLILLQIFIIQTSILSLLMNAHIERERRYRDQLKEYQDNLEEQVTKRTEELEHAKITAENAVKIKRDFLANMSHEIRTPMNGVLGMIQLLKLTELNQKQKEYVNSIYNCGQYLLTIINDLLDLSKLEAGKVDLEPEDFDIEVCVEQAIELSYSNSRHLRTDVFYHVDPSVPEIINCDNTRLRQILVNLIGNALKFTYGGKININVNRKDENTLLFSVQDTGIGIPEEKLETIFEAFSQGGIKGIYKNYGGTGLGLSISGKLVSLMGGNIWVESKVNQGSKFFFTININSYENIPYKIDKKILICEPIRDTMKLVYDYCKRLGCQVSTDIDQFCPDLFIASIDKRNNDIINVKRYIENKFKTKVMTIAITSDLSINVDDSIQIWRKPIKLSKIKNILIDKKIPIISHRSPRKISNIPILVAEDNNNNLKIICAMLESLGYSNVTTAENGLEAVNKAEGKKIILMDIHMPIMDGKTATRMIMEKYDCTIIALTADVLRESVRKYLNSGFKDYISKPVMMNKLKEVLKKWII